MSETDELSRYLAFRQLCNQAQIAMAQRLPKKVIEASAKQLGLMNKGTVYLRRQEDWQILVDFALFGFRQNGQAIVEEYVPQLPPAVSPDDQLLREAMMKTRFAIFQVDSVVPNLGLNLRDVLRHDSVFLIDQGLCRSAPHFAALVARIILLPNFALTTGAALVISEPMLRLIVQILVDRMGDRFLAQLTPDEGLELEMAVLRACMTSGAPAAER